MVRPSRPAALAVAALMAFAQPAAAISLPGGGFSVSGKKGTFLKQVANRKFDAEQGGNAMGLASDAVNQGQFQSARLQMPQTEAQVSALLTRIETNWPYAKGQPLQVHIIAVDYYSAYSLPDGSIVVAFGLLDHATSDDEVAFVLAHELGHVRLGHFAKGAAADRRRQMIGQLGQVYAVGSAMRGGMRGGAGAFNADALAATRRANAATDLLHFMNTVMIDPGHSRSQEDEADAVGFDLSQMAPYAAESASARVFDTIQADEDNRKKTSALLEEQVKKELGRAAASGAVQSVMAGGDVKTGLFKSVGRIALGVAGGSEGGPKHRPPEDRKKGVALYSVEAYPEGLPLREEQTAWLKAVRATREYSDAKVTVVAVQDAKQKRVEGDYAGAEQILAKTRLTAFRDTPVVLNEAARVRSDMGDVARADTLFMQAHQSPDQSYDGYVDHVRMLSDAGETDRALLVIEDGTRRFGDDKPFLSMLIAIAKQTGHVNSANAYLQRCLETGDDNLKKDCQTAMGDDGAQAKGGGLPFGFGGGKKSAAAAPK